jgi:hypothetical protein
MRARRRTAGKGGSDSDPRLEQPAGEQAGQRREQRHGAEIGQHGKADPAQSPVGAQRCGAVDQHAENEWTHQPSQQANERLAQKVCLHRCSGRSDAEGQPGADGAQERQDGKTARLAQHAA